MFTESVSKGADRIFSMVRDVAESGFTKTAPAMIGLAPAGIFGFTVAAGLFKLMMRTFPSIADWLAVTFSVVVGFAASWGLESAGFTSFYSALKAYQISRRASVVVLPLLYMVIGIAVLWIVDYSSETHELAWLGTAMFFLAALVYASRAVDEWTREQEAAEAEAAEAEAAEAEAADEREAADAQHERDMEKLRLEHTLAEDRKDREAARAREDKATIDKTAVSKLRAELTAEIKREQLATAQSAQPATVHSSPVNKPANKPANNGANVQRTTETNDEIASGFLSSINGDEFGWQNVADFADVKKTKAYSVIGHMVERDMVVKVTKGKYVKSGSEQAQSGWAR
jgi:hypothetical protein